MEKSYAADSFFLFGYWVTIGLSGLLPGTQKGFMVFVVLNAIAGFATPYFNTLLMAMIQQSYEPKYLGRVLGVINSLMSITGPVGLIFAGPIADNIGVEKMFMIAGIGTLVCGVVNVLIPQARNYDIELQKKIAERKRQENFSEESP